MSSVCCEYLQCALGQLAGNMHSLSGKLAHFRPDPIILPQRYVRAVGSAHVGLSRTRARRAVAQDPRAARKGISPWKARLGQNLREARNRTNYAQALNLRRALVQALTSEEHLDHLSVQVVDRGPVAQPHRFCEFRVPPLEFSLEPLYDLGMLRCEVLTLPHVL